MNSQNQTVTKHYPWLDLVRFIAAFIVVISHSLMVFIPEYEDLPPANQNILIRGFMFLAKQGHFAVLCFFILSGFFVGGKTMEKIANQSFSWKSYSIDRSVRILLPLLSSLVLTFVVNTYLGIYHSSGSYFGNLLSLQGIVCEPVNGVLWSLSYEVWCYVIMLGIGIIYSNKSTQTWGGGEIGILILISCFIVFTKLSVVYLFVWLLGLFCYKMHQKQMFSSITNSKRFIVLIILAMAIIDAIVKIKYSYLFIRYMGELIFSFLFSLIVLFLLKHEPQTYIQKKCEYWGNQLAKFSYTLYLSHYPILLLINSVFPKGENFNTYSLSLWFGSTLISLAVSYLSYLMAEKHTYAVKTLIRKKIRL